MRGRRVLDVRAWTMATVFTGLLNSGAMGYGDQTQGAMPTISTFYGILIKMYFDDHAPPDFHVEYGEHELVVTIAPIRVLRGHAPKRVLSMALEWAALHQEELLADWNLCKSLRTPYPIEPLE